MRAFLLSSVVALGLLTSSCTTTQALLITTNSLNMVGEQFLAVHAAMEIAADNGKITPEQYGKWVEFGTKFQAAYPAARQLWKIAVLTGDAILEKQATEMLSTLIPELLKFADEMGVLIMELKQ